MLSGYSLQSKNSSASVVEWMTSNPVDSLMWVRSPGDALLVWQGGKESSVCSIGVIAYLLVY